MYTLPNYEGKGGKVKKKNEDAAGTQSVLIRAVINRDHDVIALLI